MNVLIVDDDREIVRAIGIYLENEGYTAYEAYDGMSALEAVEKEDIHLIIMDVMMPGLDGIAATMKIREEKNIPIIILSAKGEDYDKIGGLAAGADDYVTKPFNPMELMARVRSQLRRYTYYGSMEKKDDTKVFRSGGLVIDDEAKQVTVDGEIIDLTPTEYGILLFLTRNAGKVYSIDQIYENVWQEPAMGADNTIAVHIRHIREKIEIDPKNPKYLKVIWGIGYKLEKIEDLDNIEKGGNKRGKGEENEDTK